MISKKVFQAIYFLGLFLGPLIAAVFFLYKSYDSFLFWWGVSHMVILILAALIVENDYKSRAGIDTQYAGYIWTLIGVGAILLSFSGKKVDINLLEVFLHGAGLAVVTSILGWTVGGWLENRTEMNYTDAARSAADDLARTLLHLKKNLEIVGTALTDAMTGAVKDIERLRKESERASDTLRELSVNLQKSAVHLSDSLNTTKSKFDAIVPKAEGFRESISVGLVKIQASVDQFVNLASHTQNVTKNVDDVADKMKDLATTVQDATNQSQQVINQVGRFIDVVFDGKTKGR